jgi:EAL domain-containing protein (putative c-di-GMP-specific phosphodiesterase class I)
VRTAQREPGTPEGRPELADLGLLIGEIGLRLSESKQLGLLSVTVLRRAEIQAEQAWRDYEAVQREIRRFLTDASTRGLRGSDVVLDPAISGNTFVILLGPPRQARPLKRTDAGLVQRRLRNGLHAHLARSLPLSTLARFGVYVGAALMHDAPVVDCERIVYRCLEESLADAMSQKQAEIPHHGADLRRILEGGEVRSVYQPLVDLRARSTIGFEALTRVAPGPFSNPEELFRTAQDHGALWNLERLCRARALDGLPPMQAHQLLFLNIESESFHDPELVGSTFLDELRRVGLAPHKIVLEVTEHSAIEDFDDFRGVLQRLRDCGFLLAMDDVGAGYSGLQAIAEIEPDFLKLDMALVRDLHNRPVKRKLISTIRRFTESTGATLVAEGVERPEELASLAHLGVRCAQGFLLAQPGCPPGSPDWDALLRHL